ncbi:BPTI/Kunitz domain-containing protein 3-like [Mytilus trossulus]|uniref:BPTI/Kunitz domain-containing protein 3-like n=1 Tax=Mytilus trossulus TaxID=6551 RepID=UPI0030066177
MLRLLILLCMPVLYAQINFQQILAWKQLPRRCRIPPYTGTSPLSHMIKIPMFYYSSQSGRCESFNYSGLGKSKNMFRNPIDCLRKCACYAPMDAGTCTNSTTGTTRYYYNRMFKMCTTFKFSGCEGNDNNFSDYVSCHIACNRRRAEDL